MNQTTFNDDEGYKIIEDQGQKVYRINGIKPDGSPGGFGVTFQAVLQWVNRGQTVRLAQFEKIVIPTLITAKHIFEGVKRPLSCGENMKADKDKLIYSWRHAYDYDWGKYRSHNPDDIDKLEVSEGKVFAVIATPNTHTLFKEIDFWIEHWCWVKESSNLAEAPNNWAERYDRKVISL